MIIISTAARDQHLGKRPQKIAMETRSQAQHRKWWNVPGGKTAPQQRIVGVCRISVSGVSLLRAPNDLERNVYNFGRHEAIATGSRDLCAAARCHVYV